MYQNFAESQKISTFAPDMQKILLFILTIVSTFALHGQTHSSADKLFQEGDYIAAQEAYGALLKSYPKEPLYLYRYARCAQEQGDFNTALQYFEKAGDRYMLKYFYIGEIYMNMWHTEDAIEAYNTYLQSLKEPNEREPYILQQIAKAEKTQRYMRRVERIQVIDSIQVSLDSLLYSHRRKIKLSNDVGKLSVDSLGHIVYTNQREDRRIWSTPVDSNLILVSNHRLLEDWTTPDTLSNTINFTQYQCAPFVLSDGVTLYFAAKDSNGLGGLDIYVSRYNTSTETYTTPENIGMPYNSPANEYLFVLDETNHVGYLATDRFAAAGKVHIYRFIIPEQKQYWKNISADSLAAYAQLQCFEDGILENDSAAPIVYCQSDSMPEFFFVINDSTIYHSINDFHNPKAKEKFNEWQLVKTQLAKEQQEIVQLRLEYATASEVRQKELTPVILQLENNQSQLSKRCQNLLLEIRVAEIND